MSISRVARPLPTDRNSFFDEEPEEVVEVVAQLGVAEREVDEWPAGDAAHHQLEQRLERFVAVERTAAPVAGGDGRRGSAQLVVEADERLVELAPHELLAVLVRLLAEADRVDGDDAAPAPAARVERGLVLVATRPPERRRVARVRVEALAAHDQHALVHVQLLGEQPAAEQLRADDEADLLLNTAVVEDAAAEELVREVHLQHAAAVVLDRPVRRDVNAQLLAERVAAFAPVGKFVCVLHAAAEGDRS